LERTSGRIGLQKHTKTVRFRRIEIKELLPEANTVVDARGDPDRRAAENPSNQVWVL
jgi:hypothetical protein